MRRLFPLLALGLLLAGALLPAAAAGGGPYIPVAGDRFTYAETIVVGDGMGNYSGYTENSNYTGSISITSGVSSNGTVAAAYESAGIFRNRSISEPWSERGTFTFSPYSYYYIDGTDNQTGYTNPAVWFYIDNEDPQGESFQFLDTTMNVVSTHATFPYSPSPTGYAAAILGEGNGTYQRNDVYGAFTATYSIEAWYDPATGYILGYLYTERDTNPSGDAFTYTDTLTDTATTFLVPSASAPAPSSSSSESAPSSIAIVLLAAVVIVLVLLLVICLARRSRRGPALPRHAPGASVGPLPTYAPPPPIGLIPRDQPPVQQVVIRETVKVPCAYCGTLMDSTAKVCPQCGAPRQ